MTQITFNNPPLEAHEYVATRGKNGEIIVQLITKDQYFVQITAEDREKVRKWLEEEHGKNHNRWEEAFIPIVKKAVQEIDYNYWIATIEPSLEDEKRIYYVEGGFVGGKGHQYVQWEKMAKEYWPKRGSRLANEYELALWYALRISEEKWTIEYVIVDSSTAGNFYDNPDSSKELEKSAARVVGGYADGQGNTYKIVTAKKDEYALVGGNFRCNGSIYTAGSIIYLADGYYSTDNSTGVVVLTK